MIFTKTKIFYNNNTIETLSNVNQDELNLLIKENLSHINNPLIEGVESVTNESEILSWRPFVGWTDGKQKLSSVIEKQYSEIQPIDMISHHFIHKSHGRFIVDDTDYQNVNNGHLPELILLGTNQENTQINVPLKECTACSNKIYLNIYSEIDLLQSIEITDEVLTENMNLLKSVNIIDDTLFNELPYSIREIINKENGSYYSDKNPSISYDLAESISEYFGTRPIQNMFNPDTLLFEDLLQMSQKLRQIEKTNPKQTFSL
jgi:hypothetical protein